MPSYNKIGIIGYVSAGPWTYSPVADKHPGFVKLRCTVYRSYNGVIKADTIQIFAWGQKQIRNLDGRLKRGDCIFISGHISTWKAKHKCQHCKRQTNRYETGITAYWVHRLGGDTREWAALQQEHAETCNVPIPPDAVPDNAPVVPKLWSDCERR